MTGVSTGALSAPFAFLGPSHDATLRAVYTELTPADILESRNLLHAALFDDGLVDTSPLFRTIARFIDDGAARGDRARPRRRAGCC